MGRGPEGFDVSPDGKELRTVHMNDGGISVINLAIKRVVARIDVGAKASNRLKITRDGNQSLVSEIGGGGLVVLDMATRAVPARSCPLFAAKPSQFRRNGTVRKRPSSSL